MEPSTPAPSNPSPHASRAESGGSRTYSTGPSTSDGQSKPDLGKRLIAIIIDCVVAAALGFVPFVGGIAGAAYMVVRDGLDLDFMRGASLGKQLMKLRPIRLDGAPMDVQTSLRRNWMFGIGALISALLYIPILGWALIPFVALISLGIGVYEIYNVLTDPQGRRWGDRLAGTQVIEESVTEPLASTHGV